MLYKKCPSVHQMKFVRNNHYVWMYSIMQIYYWCRVDNVNKLCITNIFFTRICWKRFGKVIFFHLNMQNSFSNKNHLKIYIVSGTIVSTFYLQNLTAKNFMRAHREKWNCYCITFPSKTIKLCLLHILWFSFFAITKKSQNFSHFLHK